MLKAHDIKISMDGKGRWVDNVFVERLWRSVKYEDVYLRAYETPAELRAGLTRYFAFYNTRRRHSALDRRTSVYTMVRAEHSSTVAHEGAVHSGGEPVGYVIELENGYKVYHSGDTGVFGDMKMIGEYYKPDLALVCIGGWFTMGPEEAAYAMGNLMQPKMVVPMHYGTFPPLKGTPAEFIEALGDSAIEVKVMEPGDILDM